LDAIEWTPGIGDPTFVGWFTVFMYALAALYCYRVVKGANFIFESHKLKQKRLWFVLFIFMIFLCINKQLDLQTLFTDIGRVVFTEFDMYEQRRAFQRVFVMCMLVGACLVLALLVALYFDVAANHSLALFGLVFLVTFILIRASSIHRMDGLINMRFVGFRLNWIFELSGLLMIVINARMLIRKGMPKK
jgi:hypothetical protein